LHALSIMVFPAKLIPWMLFSVSFSVGDIFMYALFSSVIPSWPEMCMISYSSALRLFMVSFSFGCY